MPISGRLLPWDWTGEARKRGWLFHINFLVITTLTNFSSKITSNWVPCSTLSWGKNVFFLLFMKSMHLFVFEFSTMECFIVKCTRSSIWWCRLHWSGGRVKLNLSCQVRVKLIFILFMSFDSKIFSNSVRSLTNTILNMFSLVWQRGACISMEWAMLRAGSWTSSCLGAGSLGRIWLSAVWTRFRAGSGVPFFPRNGRGWWVLNNVCRVKSWSYPSFLP